MKLRVVKAVSPFNRGKWKVERHGWLWGWEDFDSNVFDTYELAHTHALNCKMLDE